MQRSPITILRRRLLEKTNGASSRLEEAPYAITLMSWKLAFDTDLNA